MLKLIIGRRGVWPEIRVAENAPKGQTAGVRRGAVGKDPRDAGGFPVSPPPARRTLPAFPGSGG
jgi:hypothetical protein